MTEAFIVDDETYKIYCFNKKHGMTKLELEQFILAVLDELSNPLKPHFSQPIKTTPL